MTKLEVLVEGSSDAPVVREILTRRFGMTEGEHFRVYPHHGKGSLPADLLSPPPPQRRGLLDQLPAKLRGFSYLDADACVVVLVDADEESCVDLLSELNRMLVRLPKRPARVLFRIAVEETESWFIADRDAVAAAYPKAKVAQLARLAPDSICGAWERLAGALGTPARDVTGATKGEWARRIAPHMNLDSPQSPSLRKFIEGVARLVDRAARQSVK